MSSIGEVRGKLSRQIHDLPVELLIQIFHAAVAHLVSRNRSSTLTRLSSVCRNWRGVVEGTPFLWAHIHNGCSSYHNSRALSLSQNEPLDIVFKAQTARPGDGLQHEQRMSYINLLHNVETHRARWCTLLMEIPPDIIEASSPAVAELDSPLLEQLHLFQMGVYHLDLIRPITIHFIDASALRELIGFSDVTPTFALKGSTQLRRIHLYHSLSVPLSSQDLVEVLRQSPLLEELILHNIVLLPMADEGPVSPAVPARLHHLEILLLQWVDKAGLTEILDGIDAPVLRFVSVGAWLATSQDPNASDTLQRVEKHFRNLMLPVIPIVYNLSIRISIQTAALQIEALASLDRSKFPEGAELFLHDVPFSSTLGWVIAALRTGIIPLPRITIITFVDGMNLQWPDYLDALNRLPNVHSIHILKRITGRAMLLSGLEDPMAFPDLRTICIDCEYMVESELLDTLAAFGRRYHANPRAPSPMVLNKIRFHDISVPPSGCAAVFEPWEEKFEPGVLEYSFRHLFREK